MFNLELEFHHTEAEGDLFDEMEMKLEAIASMSGMSGIFRLLGADVYKLTSIKTFRKSVYHKIWIDDVYCSNIHL